MTSLARRRLIVTAAACGAAVVSGCTDSQQAPADSSSDDGGAGGGTAHATPTLVGEQAPTIPWDALNLPLEMTTMIVVDPGWRFAAQQLEGTFVGVAEQEDHLLVRCVESDGTVLWEAARPRGCEAFVLTRTSQGEPVVVLADAPTRSAADQRARSLTAYHLRTAAPVWGPIPAPHGLAGPGLLLADADGNVDAALAADSGDVIVSAEDVRDGVILAEHLGSVLARQGSTIMLRDPAGKAQWTVPLPQGIAPATLRALGRIDTRVPLVALADAGGSGCVLDMHDGSILAEDALAVERDAALEVAVVTHGSVVRGIDDTGGEAWRYEDPARLELVSAGERLAYAVRAETRELVVLDTGQGAAVVPYDMDVDAPLGMPETFSDDAAAVRAGERRVLVTSQSDPEFGMRVS